MTAVLSGTSIGEVIVTNVGRGFNEVPNPPRIIATRNTNGIGIVSTSSNGVTNTLQIVQPTNGWFADGSDFPFSVGEQIFVEGVALHKPYSLKVVVTTLNNMNIDCLK